MSEPETYLRDRRRRSDERLSDFRRVLRSEIPRGEWEVLIGDHTCVYAVGSGGRRELGTHSDLDVFLVRDGKRKRTDEARLQTAVIRAMGKAKFDPPSNDGEYITLHTLDDMIERLGGPHDDSANTFTGRMLLLLEGRPLLGDEVFGRLVERSLDAYWKNVDGHRTDYLPIILVNDIVRYWRIVLLNYEARTAEKVRRLEAARLTERRHAAGLRQIDSDRRARSLKLRFTRCLMCYASVAYLLAEARATGRVHGKANVTKERVAEMVRLAPLDRLAAAVRLAESREVRELAKSLRSGYARFLQVTDQPKADLAAVLAKKREREALFRDAEGFGGTMFRLLEALGRDNRLYRYVVV